MSVTFYMPQAPLERVQPYPDEVDYFEQRPVEPFMEINLANGNVNAMLRLVAPAYVRELECPYGEWDQDELAKVKGQALSALNSAIVLNSATKQTQRSVGERGCKVLEVGRSDDYVERRLLTFVELATVALVHGFNVHFG